jgi:hypothetical protein
VPYSKYIIKYIEGTESKKSSKDFPFPKRLQFNLQKLLPIFDFSTIIVNKKVATLDVGTEFGELALN